MFARSNRLQLKYLWGGMATYLPGESFGPRTLNDFEFVWIIDGDVTYTRNGRDHAASPGTLILGRPGLRERYGWDRHHPSRHAFFHFAIEAVPDDWPAPDGWRALRRMPPGDVVRPLFRRVLDAWCGRWEHRDQRPVEPVCRLVAAMIDGFLAADEEVGGSTYRPLPDPVRRAVDWAQRRLLLAPDEPLDLDELAGVAKVSPSHLTRLFKRALNTTPMHAIQLMRLERAATLLARSNLNVKGVAHRCGFASPFHFSRTFRREYGLSPSAMRKQLEAGEPLPPARLPSASPPLES